MEFVTQQRVRELRSDGGWVIESKSDYRFYDQADKIALSRQTARPMIEDDIWKYERLLRKVEYYRNCRRSSPSRLYLKWLYYRFHILGRKLGFTIPPNVFGPGLAILHRGTIVVNHRARVGENCRINACVNIGTEAKFQDKAPRIGNNVYIGPGAKIFGDIQIADNVAIGANAVVNSSVDEPGITIGGIPARKISDAGSEGLVVKATEILRTKA